VTIEVPPQEAANAVVPDVPPIDASGTIVGAPRTGRRWVDIAAPLLGIAIFFGLWFLMHEWLLESVFDKPNFLVPSPVTVVDQAFLDGDVRGDLLKGILWTAVVALLGLSISIVLGMSIAILMAQATWIERSFWPYLIAAQAIPILAIVPLIGNILGFGLGSRVLVCVIISIFPIVSNTLFGLLSADASQHDLFTLKGVSRWSRLRKLQLPGAMPAIFTGFRTSAGLCVIGAVVGELFFRRGGKGIGILIEQYRANTRWAPAYGALVMASLLGFAVFMIFGWISKLVVGKWHEPTRQRG